MLCPKCKLELLIDSSVLEVEGDDSPDTETVINQVQTLICRNPNCEDNGKVVFYNRVRIN